MASFPYGMPNYYQGCNGNASGCQCSSGCCYNPQCYCYSQSQHPYVYQQHQQHTRSSPDEKEKPKAKRNTRPPRKTKAAKSRSSCSLGLEFCGDNKENNHRTSNASSTYSFERKGGYDCKRNCHRPTNSSCCSSSRKPQDYGAQKRGRRQSQPRHVPAPGCDINRLIAMVRRPLVASASHSDSYSHPQYEDPEGEYDADLDVYEVSQRSQRPLPALPSTELELHAVRNSSDFTCIDADDESDYDLDDEYDANHFGHTRVQFMPPASCLFLVTRGAEEHHITEDREVQCCFDISSDFCICSKEMCEYCGKKVMCTCKRIRCCLCGKLKTTSDRKVHQVEVCRCTRTFRCCETATSFLGFNSTPALNKELSECDGDADGNPSI